MELVDANTKNYVFLTLSQYNDQQSLVRTRVSMRRDQPFWDGGNSYICCESFRISSSPSQGGLYYKIFPPEWYMGCQMSPSQGNPGDTTAAWETSQRPATGDNPHEVGQSLMPKNPEFSNNGAIVSCRLNVWGVMNNGDVGAIESQDPRVVRTRLEQYLNKAFLTDSSWIRLIEPSTDANGHDNSKWVKGKCIGSPAATIVGNGLGDRKLYYPEISVNDPTQQVTKLTAIANLAEAALPDTTIEWTFNGLSQPYSPSGPGVLPPPMSADERSKLFQSIGTGLFIQCRTSSVAPKDWGAPVSGGMLEVLGPSGAEYHFQKRFFKDMNTASDQTDVGKCTGSPWRPMHYNNLAVGEVCWITIGSGDTKFPQGTYYGTITKLPPAISQISVFVRATKTLWDYLQTNAPAPSVPRLALASSRWIFSSTPEPLNAAIHAMLKFQIEGNNGVSTQQEITQWIGHSNPFIQFAANRNENQQMCIRRPDKYMYTPNEMFLSFNHKENIRDVGYQDLPYKLQTDENGGFKVWWQVLDTHSDSFVISVGLSEALGLNPWFEYDGEEHLNDVATSMAYVQKVNYDPQQNADEPAIWIDHKDISLSNTSWEPVTLPPPAGPAGGPLKVYDASGTEYEYIRNYQFLESRYQSVRRYIYPSMHTDEFGTQFYRYQNLPSYGWITNTQMVSVESFSTYSEITIVIPNLPFQSMLGTSSDERILASLRLPFENGTSNDTDGAVVNSSFGYYGDLIFNTLASRSYLKVTTDQALYDCDVEVRLIRRDGQMDVMQLPYQGEFQVKLRLIQTQ